jgi:hypothetical protein
MRKSKLISLSAGTLAGIYFIHKYRFLTIDQFAKVANLSSDHARKVLHKLEARGAVGYFGFVSIPGHGRTPKVYYLKRKGFEYLRNEGGIDEDELGAFTEAHQEVSWSPQMYHRLRLLDLVIGLETQVRDRPHLELIETFIEYRRVSGTHYRETSDYVAEPFTSETRIVPDGAFVLENRETNRRGLFFLEMDMGSERIVAKASQDTRATVTGKMVQYDRYLTSGRFAKRYETQGDFTLATILFVTYGAPRIEAIRSACAPLPLALHGYYRLAEFGQAVADFLGPVWKSRDPGDALVYGLVKDP